VGSGNHFVEFVVCSEITDRTRAWQVGMARDEVVVLIHSGSRTVGRYVGSRWMAKARESWPAGLAHPQSGLYGLSGPAAREYPDIGFARPGRRQDGR
jgi:tRNA-splicing ligase RtcB (3'-phosphate/5'-hydroxy nucleic acid ligase)